MGEKLTKIVIDVSKKSLDVCIYREEKSKKFKFENEEKGFKKLIKKVEEQVSGERIYFLMESTGIYHLKLALY